MKIGFLFAGQGSQHPGMGKDFYEQYDAARRLYDSIDTDIPVKELCFNGTQEQLNDTAVAQLLGFSPMTISLYTCLLGGIEIEQYSFDYI